MTLEWLKARIQRVGVKQHVLLPAYWSWWDGRKEFRNVLPGVPGTLHSTRADSGINVKVKTYDLVEFIRSCGNLRAALELGKLGTAPNVPEGYVYSQTGHGCGRCSAGRIGRRGRQYLLLYRIASILRDSGKTVECIVEWFCPKCKWRYDPTFKVAATANSRKLAGADGVEDA